MKQLFDLFCECYYLANTGFGVLVYAAGLSFLGLIAIQARRIYRRQKDTEEL
jgi:hypothetical protein